MMETICLPDDDRALADLCVGIRKAVQAGIDWVGNNTDAVRQEAPSLLKDLRKSGVALTRLERAAQRKMCVGVFGPSQHGKSYLISAMARPMQALIGGDRVDFLAEINPEGGGESTGLVTRFTLDPPKQTHPTLPVAIRLLSVADLVKVLVNAYVFDISHAEEDEDSHDSKEILECLDQIAGGAGGVGGILDAEDLYDLEDYCNQRLIANPRIKRLRHIGFWDRCAELAPRLSLAELGELFALLWDDFQVFNDLFDKLGSVLAALDFEIEVWCSLEALFESSAQPYRRRRNGSIINVSTLRGLDGASWEADTVTVGTPQGRQTQAPRCAITALISELRIQMAQTPYEFFRHTDLLDFPGARSRTALKISQETMHSDIRSELMLRGKVAYLFEQYCTEQELTSLLLCGGPENNDVVADIDPLVHEWIRTTHGETPEQRANQDNALFFVLTKFDRSFEQSVGKENPFPIRLNTSLLEPYCKLGNWPREWNPRGAFSNCFAVRNPNFRQEAMFDYASEDRDDKENYYRETGIRPQKQEQLRRYRQLFLGSAEVERHFAEPERAWEAVMSLNDGGVGYLMAKLEPLCNPNLKRSQIAGRLTRLREALVTRLQVYHVSGDQDAQLEKKRRIVQGILFALAGGCIKQHRFAQLLETLQIAERDLFDLHHRAINDKAPIQDARAETDEEARPGSPGAFEVGLLGDLVDFSDEGDGGRFSVPTATPALADFAASFARRVESFWVESLRGLPEDSARLRYLLLDIRSATGLTEELVTGARRNHIFRRIEEEVRKFDQFKEDSHVWKQITPARNILNDFVAFLNYGGRACPQGTQAPLPGGKQRHIFPPKPRIQGLPELPAQSPELERDFARDWLTGFQRLAEENVAYQAGIQGDMEQNRQLGRVIAVLAGQGQN